MLLLVPLCAPPARGQDLLTLERATADALAHNRTLAAARAAASEADARASEARSGFFPRVSFTESWQRSDQPVFAFSSLLSARRFAASDFAVDTLNNPGAVSLFRGLVGVEQLIFDGGRTAAAVDSAAQGRAMARASAEEAETMTALRVAQAYGRVLTAESGKRAADAAVAAAAEDVAHAERRRDAGTATDADVLSLAVHLADLRQRAIQMAGDAAIARAELNRLRGAPVASDFTVREPPIAGAVRGDWTTLAAEAEAARPELRRASAAVALAETGQRQARAAWCPQVAAQAGYQIDGTSFADRASSWLVGGELRWNFSAGGAQVAAARAAADAVARARAEHDEARAAVQVDVLSALRRLESAEARERVARTAVDQARESQRIIRDRYEAGLAGVQDVLRASTAVLDAENRRVASLVDRVGADAALRHALGRKAS